MGFPTPTLLLLLIPLFLTTPTSAATFNCTTTTTTSSPCHALIDYVIPNTTTLNSIKTLFNISHLRSLLGANDFPLSTPPNHTLPEKSRIIIPFRCLCRKGSGVSNYLPTYTVKPNDYLNHIANEIFSGLVNYTEIAAVNHISNPDLIQIGQSLWIPLPCSCDEVDGNKVVHYGHVVEAGSSVQAIADKYGTTQETLLRINGIADPKSLQANQVLDVPLKACSSSVRNDSFDAPLLVSNNTYVFTANDCVKCQCSSTQNWTLQCEPSNLGSTCPAMQCQGGSSDKLYIGNSTTSSTCNQTTCAYAGYNNQTIFTIPSTKSTCAPNKNNASKMGLQGLSWNFLFMTIHLVLLFLHILQ